jgi:hypothetical protein
MPRTSKNRPKYVVVNIKNTKYYSYLFWSQYVNKTYLKHNEIMAPKFKTLLHLTDAYSHMKQLRFGAFRSNFKMFVTTIPYFKGRIFFEHNLC